MVELNALWVGFGEKKCSGAPVSHCCVQYGGGGGRERTTWFLIHDMQIRPLIS